MNILLESSPETSPKILPFGKKKNNNPQDKASLRTLSPEHAHVPPFLRHVLLLSFS